MEKKELQIKIIKIKKNHEKKKSYVKLDLLLVPSSLSFLRISLLSLSRKPSKISQNDQG
jgi:hypothetical protein